MSAPISAERRAKLTAKYRLNGRSTWHRSAHPITDADEEAARQTRRLSPGASDNAALAEVVHAAIGFNPLVRATAAEMAEALPYLYSNLARRRLAPYKRDGTAYSADELDKLTALEHKTSERHAGYLEALDMAERGMAGEREVVLIGGPRRDGGLLVFPTVPNLHATAIPDDGVTPLRPGKGDGAEQAEPADVLAFDPPGTNDQQTNDDPDDIDWENFDWDDDDEPAEPVSPIAHIEPAYAWSVTRLVYRLYYRHAQYCVSCALEGELCGSSSAVVIGRGQRIFVLPSCMDCAERYRNEYAEPWAAPLTIWIMDGFHEQRGWFEDWWF